jgi:hypothetical protein
MTSPEPDDFDEVDLPGEVCISGTFAQRVWSPLGDDITDVATDQEPGEEAAWDEELDDEDGTEGEYELDDPPVGD